MSLWSSHAIALPWCEPLAVANALRDQHGTVALIAGAGAPDLHGGRWSYVACDPDMVRETGGLTPRTLFDMLRAPDWACAPVIGVASYDAGARAATGQRDEVWPDLMAARYPALLVFDHANHRVEARGYAASQGLAEGQAQRATRWHAMALPPQMGPAPCSIMHSEMSALQYQSAVAQVVERIGAGELFQANIARGWHGALNSGAHPFGVLVRLSQQRGAAYGAYWSLNGRAIVSNSPELFVRFDPDTRRIEARPIKGTAPRGQGETADEALATSLLNSAKDRAENLMIVDLMRNDLARVSDVGSVQVEVLCGLERHPSMHHLTSVVSATVRADLGALDVLQTCFPAGSITGAPKHQAMKVIADLEPPRGAWCGSIFGLNLRQDGDLIASVLIRTATFECLDEAWRWRALAGAGITAYSDPSQEAAETEVKISALRWALTGRAV